MLHLLLLYWQVLCHLAPLFPKNINLFWQDEVCNCDVNVTGSLILHEVFKFFIMIKFFTSEKGNFEIISEIMSKFY